MESGGEEAKIESESGTAGAEGTTMLLILNKSRTNMHLSGRLCVGTGRMGVLLGLRDRTAAPLPAVAFWANLFCLINGSLAFGLSLTT